ncbi:bleomycin resistance protein [Devosia sp. XJ19-1]|uniref:Bleomycin resistance protein n=1 Tax=Devosia ureilytica TaxID=2952754 RepID=A0A9Q4ALU5_9HYPH|nr:bleomycin resistance protein [Devosia ureilytica]MCP8882044.1 bleomycin resistance protein [Devosia ureilytica]MCP8886070.1 bleomycin resistance protein [Devosia ureilytica]
MTDRATPNLPSRNFSVTKEFYAALGFERQWRDDVWLILRRGELTLEFFLFAELDPASSSFGTCLRLDDLDGFYQICQRAGVPEQQKGWPRLHPPRLEAWGGRVGALVDPDCTLIRLIQN